MLQVRENHTDSIPDILQTLSAAAPATNNNSSSSSKANVIVNELSDIEMEADLVDLNSPELSHKVSQ